MTREVLLIVLPMVVGILASVAVVPSPSGTPSRRVHSDPVKFWILT